MPVAKPPIYTSIQTRADKVPVSIGGAVVATIETIGLATSILICQAHKPGPIPKHDRSTRVIWFRVWTGSSVYRDMGPSRAVLESSRVVVCMDRILRGSIAVLDLIFEQGLCLG